MTKQAQPLIDACLDSLSIIIKRAGSDKAAFMRNDILQDAILMRILEAGDYLARVRDGFSEYYDVHKSDAWDKLIGLRNIIAHGYLKIDHEKVWDITQRELPDLASELVKLVS